MRKGRVLVLLAALTGLALQAGCAGMPGAMEPLNVTLADVRPAQVGLLEQEYAMKIRVQNPNGAEIPLQGMSFSVDLNGKAFAKGVSPQSLTIPAFGDVVLDVTAVSSLGDVLEQVSLMRQGAPDRITYRLQGKLASASGSRMPFDSTGTIDLSGLAGARQ
jgi:LEA14-like dessication related protein